MPKTEKKNFVTPIHLFCGGDDLRPSMMRVLFEDGKAVATDAHMLIRQALTCHGFTPEEIAFMEGKQVSGKTIKEIMRYDHVTVDKSGFNCTKGDIQATFPFVEYEEKYPNYKPIIEKIDIGHVEPVTEIGFNLNLLERIKKVALSSSSYAGTRTATFEFYGASKAMLVTTAEKGYEDEMILIMPVMLGR